MTVSKVGKTQASSRGLNPEAPEFFPARNVQISAANHPFYPPANPTFLHYQTLYSCESCLDPLGNFSAPPRFHYPLYPFFPYHHHAAVPCPVLAPEKLAPPQVAQEVPTRRRTKDKRCLRNTKRHGKERFVRAKLGSFEYTKKVNDRAGNITNGEKHPLIPLRDDGKETTVMIKNIPNRYTREMLKDFMDQHCMNMNRNYSNNGDVADEEPSFSAFDFLYLPVDFITKLNKGYAFVNFTSPRAARRFSVACHGEHWDRFQSTKIREICCAKLQGIEQLVRHFERMGFPCEEFQPLSFNPARDGSKQLVKETLVGRLTVCFSVGYGRMGTGGGGWILAPGTGKKIEGQVMGSTPSICNVFS
ncbi:hypothetical protein V6N13_149580 [Hibiscus sabdariffa]|uniref:Mei2-like C-terminal RNA recognition motif domain-containing protein n=1 Tax=Hibiscus sabdariffa TaxID=183260 RepID=A0ABR2EGY8_9ROSI